MIPVFKHVAHLSLGLLIASMCALSSAANAAEVNPLRPVDTTSPRATLQDFVTRMDEVQRVMTDVLREYAASGRLYPTADQRRREAGLRPAAKDAIKALDLSDVPPVLRETVAAERAVQLKEIFDRIELPPLDTMPDQNAAAGLPFKRWRLPGTEIDIALVTEGPRSGEYLFSAATVDRLPEFYERVKKLPYKPGPAAELSEVYHKLSSGGAATIYDAYLSSPVGLERIVPIRWLLRLPAWAKAPLASVALWQWLGLTVGLAVCFGFVYGMYRLSRHLGGNRADESGPGWHAVLTPLALILVTAFPVPLLYTIFRIGGIARIAITFIQTGLLYLSAAWLSAIVASLLAEAVIASEHLRTGSLDSQLIRLGMRFAGIVIAVGLLIQGSWELGFPTYSVLAGLGVGGLAVALAARDSLANLLGSMLIMIEKPFRVGHYIRLSGSEGTVEDVGFRSTRMRTPDNSLISIPNNTVVNTTVENLSLRPMRRQRFLVQVTYDTPREKIEKLVAGLKQLIADHPLTNKSSFNVRFNDFGESSLNILVVFHIATDNYPTELETREEILLQIMDLAQNLGIEFAFPTRTLVIDNPLAAETGLARAQVGVVQGRR